MAADDMTAITRKWQKAYEDYLAMFSQQSVFLMQKDYLEKTMMQLMETFREIYFQTLDSYTKMVMEETARAAQVLEDASRQLVKINLQYMTPVLKK